MYVYRVFVHKLCYILHVYMYNSVIYHSAVCNRMLSSWSIFIFSFQIAVTLIVKPREMKMMTAKNETDAVHISGSLPVAVKKRMTT